MGSSDGLLAFGVFDVSVVLFTGPEKLLPVLNCTEGRLRLRHNNQYVSAADWFHRTDPTSRAKFDKPQDAPDEIRVRSQQGKGATRAGHFVHKGKCFGMICF